MPGKVRGVSGKAKLSLSRVQIGALPGLPLDRSFALSASNEPPAMAFLRGPIAGGFCVCRMETSMSVRNLAFDADANPVRLEDEDTRSSKLHDAFNLSPPMPLVSRTGEIHYTAFTKFH